MKAYPEPAAGEVIGNSDLAGHAELTVAETHSATGELSAAVIARCQCGAPCTAVTTTLRKGGQMVRVKWERHLGRVVSQ